MKTIISLFICIAFMITMTGCNLPAEQQVEQEISENEKIEQEILDDLIPASSFEITNTDGEVLLTAEHLAKAEWMWSNNNSDAPAEPVVCLTFNLEGTAKFADVTKEYIGQELPMLLDGEIIASPVINAPITTGEAIVSGFDSMEEAIAVAARIQSVIDNT